MKYEKFDWLSFLSSNFDFCILNYQQRVQDVYKIFPKKFNQENNNIRKQRMVIIFSDSSYNFPRTVYVYKGIIEYIRLLLTGLFKYTGESSFLNIFHFNYDKNNW